MFGHRPYPCWLMANALRRTMQRPGNEMTTITCAPTRDNRLATSPGWTGLLFAAIPLIIGFIPPSLVFGLNPNAASDIGLTALTIPAWVFIGVWVIAYPSMGMAAWLLWKLRSQLDACVPIGILIAGFIISLSFWLTNSLRMTATLDAITLILAWTTLWVFSRYSRRAALWLLPWAIWMPITFGVKLLAITID